MLGTEMTNKLYRLWSFSQNDRREIARVLATEEFDLEDWIKKEYIKPESQNDIEFLSSLGDMLGIEWNENTPEECLSMYAPEESETREAIQGQKIFLQGDCSDGLYVLASGTVKIIKDGQILSELGDHGFFGEIGVLDDSPRGGDAIAETDATLLFIEKEIFNSITEDLPEVLRAVTKAVIGYLKKQEGDMAISSNT